MRKLIVLFLFCLIGYGYYWAYSAPPGTTGFRLQARQVVQEITSFFGAVLPGREALPEGLIPPKNVPAEYTKPVCDNAKQTCARSGLVQEQMQWCTYVLKQCQLSGW